MGNWDVVIGLEIHAQLQTQTKIFAPDSAEFSNKHNKHISNITLGMPGVLPVVNEKVIEYAVRIGLALNGKILQTSTFARKHYFYPDLPKGYQISQFDLPICKGGFVEFKDQDGSSKKVNLERAHMEEDAGKSSHKGGYSLIDYNRAGVPLLEIVSAPDMTTPYQAAEYARTIRRILRYLEVSDGNLEEGSMRCDCNVSIKPKGELKLGTKVEIKNINSFRFIEKAVEYEISRQISLVEAGEKILQETRLYDSAKNKTFSMRSKEEAMDYRYFPDPDLLPVTLTEEYIKKIESTLPELPLAKAKRFEIEFAIPEYDAQVLTADKDIAAFYEKTANLSGNNKAASNWIMGDLLKNLKESDLEFKQIKITPENLAEMIKLIDSGKISGKIAKQIFEEMWISGKKAESIVTEKGLSQISDRGAITQIVEKIIKTYPDQVSEYRSGKNKLYGFFVGQIMKESKGQANPEMLNKILKEKLDS